MTELVVLVLVLISKGVCGWPELTIVLQESRFHPYDDVLAMRFKLR